MSRSNIWSNPTLFGRAETVRLAAFLEERSSTPDIRESNAAFCRILDPKPGERILEVGSGSGVISRLIAPYLNPNGTMVGLDISPDLVLEAQKFAFQEELSGQIDFVAGTGEALPYAPSAFDCTCAARLLLHVEDPHALLLEMLRLVRPGGRVIVMDWDFESVVVDHPNRGLTRRVLHWRNDHHGGDNWSGRQLRRRMTSAGLKHITVHPVVTVAKDEAYSLTQTLWRAAQLSRDNGVITPEEHDFWVGDLKNRITEGTFFASIVYFIVKGIIG